MIIFNSIVLTAVLISVYILSVSWSITALGEQNITKNSTNMSVGLLSVSIGNITDQRVVGIDADGMPILEIFQTGEGKINGNISFTEMWTFLTKQDPNGIQHGKGIGAIMTKDGSNEIVTATSQGMSSTESGITSYIGANFYSTSSKGQLAFMNDLIGMFESDDLLGGNYTTKVWKWK